MLASKITARPTDLKADALIKTSLEIAASGTPLMHRVVPMDADFRVWDHYPTNDAVDSRSGARWFYHAHPVEDRNPAEHGHFHLFLSKDAFAQSGVEPLLEPPGGMTNGVETVHIIALSMDYRGVPRELFTVNRWVTDEWLYPASAIIERLDRFELESTDGDSLVNHWLMAMVGAFRSDIVDLLAERDRCIECQSGQFGEDRSFEILSRREIDLITWG